MLSALILREHYVFHEIAIKLAFDQKTQLPFCQYNLNQFKMILMGFCFLHVLFGSFCYFWVGYGFDGSTKQSRVVLVKQVFLLYSSFG